MDSDAKDGRFVVGLAAAGDIDDIVALLQANEPTRGGSLTVRFERAQVAGFVEGDAGGCVVTGVVAVVYG